MSDCKTRRGSAAEIGLSSLAAAPERLLSKDLVVWKLAIQPRGMMLPFRRRITDIEVGKP
jgi:hypothetical protein